MKRRGSMERKQVKLLHLYPDLMNLYGDWANIAVLERELFFRGCDVRVDKKSIGDDIGFGLYDFIYIGSGTERSQAACIKDLLRYKETFIGQIEADTPVLATGNSHELFGKVVTDCDGTKHEMLGLLDFETEQIALRITGDCTFESLVLPLQDKFIGFINRAGGYQSGKVMRPFSVKPGKGAGFEALNEGIIYKNLLGTYITGPILVRNPPLLMYFADLIHKHEKEENDLFFTYQEMAYKTALNELN